MKLKPNLEQRISEVRSDCAAYILERAKEIKQGNDLPLQVIEQMLYGKGQCACAVALRVAEDRRRDAAILAAQVDNEKRRDQARQ